MRYSFSCLAALALALAASAAAVAVPVQDRSLVKECGKQLLCSPTVGSKVADDFSFLYHGVSGQSAHTEYLKLSFHPYGGAARPGHLKGPAHILPSRFTQKAPHSTYMFEGKTTLPCGLDGEYTIYVHDHQVSGAMSQKSVTTTSYGPFKVTSKKC